MFLTSEGFDIKADMLAALLLEELPPGKATVLFARISSVIDGLSASETAQVINRTSTKLYGAAEAYAKQLPEGIKQFTG